MKPRRGGEPRREDLEWNMAEHQRAEVGGGRGACERKRWRPESKEGTKERARLMNPREEGTGDQCRMWQSDQTA